MSAPAIRVDGLWKEYVINGNLAVQPTFREAVAESFQRPWQRLSGRAVRPAAENSFWALKDVSLEIEPGEVVGIIGRNGAGKSTLLKVLSRITAPTRGTVEIRGRISSLLEVGTGFHPELTGRENIRLNGAILGMSQSEIRMKFDEIVAFSGVEKFIDTPVKRYSSGMLVRLAFAVAAHLEPEILIVDEVLAVGDAEFQRKCLGKMEHIASSGGRTVLFVSHNLSAVKQLCSRSLLLTSGSITADGGTESVLQDYFSGGAMSYEIDFEPSDDKLSITRITVDRENLGSKTLTVDIHYYCPSSIDRPVGGITLRSNLGEPVWGSNGRFHPYTYPQKTPRTGVLRCEARQLPISSGLYSLSIWLGDWVDDYDIKLDVLAFQLGSDEENRLRPSSASIGHVEWQGQWLIL